MRKKTKRKFKGVGEMLVFLRAIGKRNEVAIKKLDREIKKYEILERGTLSIQDSKIKYSPSAKKRT